MAFRVYGGGIPRVPRVVVPSVSAVGAEVLNDSSRRFAVSVRQKVVGVATRGLRKRGHMV